MTRIKQIYVKQVDRACFMAWLNHALPDTRAMYEVCDWEPEEASYLPVFDAQERWGYEDARTITLYRPNNMGELYVDVQSGVMYAECGERDLFKGYFNLGGDIPATCCVYSVRRELTADELRLAQELMIKLMCAENARRLAHRENVRKIMAGEDECDPGDCE